MPIRFRCVYCNQLLGIARRKAGTVVRCTSCNGQIIVPEPEAAQQAASSSGSREQSRQQPVPIGPSLFERGDIDELLRLGPPAEPSPPPPAARTAENESDHETNIRHRPSPDAGEPPSAQTPPRQFSEGSRT